MSTLAGQHVVVIGGSSGIGLASTRRLVSAGARVTIASRSRDRLQRAAASVDGPVHTAVLDCTDEPAVQQFFTHQGELDHLIVTAGDHAVDAPAAELDTVVARRVFEVKYWGQYFAARHAAPRIRAGGSITLFSAWLARKPTAGFPTYAAIDGAIEAVGRVMALEFAPVRVNMIAPGVIDTPLFGNLTDEQRETTFGTVAGAVALGRVGTADDVARAVEYVVGSPYSTGAVIDVDGGWL